MSNLMPLALFTLWSAPAFAQTLPDLARPNTILVTGSGKVETPPDLATLELAVRGEGKTPDAATTALAAKQRAVFGGLRSLDPKLDIRTGAIALREVKGGDCSDRGGGGSAADMMDDALDTLEQTASGGAPETRKGSCRVVGHVASTETSVRLAAVAQAGTAVGLAGRLGASSARIEAFGLRDDSAPAQRALSDAMANARTQATALAAASRLRLGPVVSIMRADPNGRTLFDVPSTYNLQPAAIAQAPIVLDIAPSPVETRAQIVVSFALLP